MSDFDEYETEEFFYDELMRDLRDQRARYDAEQAPSKEVRAVDPNTGGAKGRKPEEYAMIPPFALSEVARVYGMGAKKYSANNWALGYPYTWALSALYRHVEAFRRGENVDPESGLSHLAHATFHLFTLMEFEKHSLGTDDRWIPRTPPTQGNLGMFGEEKS